MSSLETQHINLLLIEDNRRDLTQFIAGLERFGYQHMETARDPAEARAKLDEKLFDVIVADMRLENDGAGDFVLLSEVKRRKITSVVIILTANDSVADSRRAFKEGAWDYISKNMEGNVFEELDKSIRDARRYFNQRGHDKDSQWIEDNITPLVTDYGGQHIAVMNNQVIVSAETEDNLKALLRDKNYPFFMPIIKKIEVPTNAKPSIADLIQRGESATLEFRRSLQWSVKENRAQQDLHFAVLKTIAAFLNSEGGTLLIGVADDGTINGLQGDLSLEEGGTLDEFEQTLLNLINNRISAAFSPLINVRFEEIEGKHVCAVEVQGATGPVFMNGQRGIEFYIRVDNTTLAPRSEEMYHYIRTHWT